MPLNPQVNQIHIRNGPNSGTTPKTSFKSGIRSVNSFQIVNAVKPKRVSGGEPNTHVLPETPTKIST